MSSNQRVTDARLAELTSHYSNVDEQHNGWWIALYWCLRELQERRAGETAVEPKAGDPVWVSPVFGCPTDGWTIDRVERKTTVYLKHPNGSLITCPPEHWGLKAVAVKTNEQPSAPSVAKQLSTEPSSSRSACEGSGPATVGAGPIRRLPQ